MTTILIVDDHASFRATARALLEADGYSVVGEAVDGEHAVAEAARLHPDVVLLDVQLPDTNGFEVARRVAASTPAPQVVLTSSRDAADYGDAVAEAPVRGFIPKDELTGAAIAELLAP